jgi:iron complex transport system permease protein
VAEAELVLKEYGVLRRRAATVLAAALTTLLILILVSISSGEMHIPAFKLVKALIGLSRLSNVEAAAVSIRAARALTAVIVGAALASAGAAIQSVMRNPLASPFTLGVSQAAAFGAAVAIIVLGAGYSEIAASPIARSPYIVSAAAFVSSLAAMFAVYSIGRARGMTPAAVVLAGVAIGFLFQALTMLVEYLAPNEVLVAAALFWMFGDVSRTTWGEIAFMSAIVLPSILYFTARWMEYNALLLGDDTAASLGINPSRVREETIVLASLVTAATIAFVGVIGFIGLIAPHIARLLVGRNYRYLMPLSAATGAILLLAADTMGRLMLSPNILPVGITTSLIGAPLLVVLLSREEKPWRSL